MDSRTTEIYTAEEIRDIAKYKPEKLEDMDLKQLKVVTPEEIAQGHAMFETWAEALGLKLNTRQLRRKAQRRYLKALKRMGK